MSILNDSQGEPTQTHVDRTTGGPRILHIINKIDTPTKIPSRRRTTTTVNCVQMKRIVKSILSSCYCKLVTVHRMGYDIVIEGLLERSTPYHDAQATINQCCVLK